MLDNEKKSIGFAPKDLAKELGVRKVDLKNGLTDMLDPRYLGSGGEGTVFSVNGKVGNVVLDTSDLKHEGVNLADELNLMKDADTTLSSRVDNVDDEIKDLKLETTDLQSQIDDIDTSGGGGDTIFPVTSVNGYIGDIVLTATDIPTVDATVQTELDNVMLKNLDYDNAINDLQTQIDNIDTGGGGESGGIINPPKVYFTTTRDLGSSYYSLAGEYGRQDPLAPFSSLYNIVEGDGVYANGDPIVDLPSFMPFYNDTKGQTLPKFNVPHGDFINVNVEVELTATWSEAYGTTDSLGSMMKFELTNATQDITVATCDIVHSFLEPDVQFKINPKFIIPFRMLTSPLSRDGMRVALTVHPKLILNIHKMKLIISN